MDNKIFRNSYVVFVITFILLYVIFYLVGIGYTTEIINGKPVIKFSWRYPLGLSLIVWVFWHYFLYPIDDNLKFKHSDDPIYSDQVKNSADEPIRKTLKSMKLIGGHTHQKINMKNWH